MKIVILISSFLLAFLIVYPFYRLYKNPNDTLIKYLFDWRYRALREYRQWYLQGQSHTPPDSFEFWYNSVVNDLDTGEHAKRPLYEREALCEMLRREEYVSYYFQEGIDFNGDLSKAMFDDYRSRLYLSRNYDDTATLIKNLPIEITSKPRAFADYMKFVELKWFDSKTGRPNIKESPDKTKVPGDTDITGNIGTPDSIETPSSIEVLGDIDEPIFRKKYEIGRVIYWICRRNQIPDPGKVFSPCWGIPEKTINEWTRPNRNEETAKDLDKKIKDILKKTIP